MKTMIDDNFYNKETIDAKLEAIHDTAKRIEIQTTKTNGRVTKLEVDMNKWKYIIVGGLAVASLMGAPGLFTIVKAMSGI